MIKAQLQINNIKAGIRYSSASLAKEIGISKGTMSAKYNQIMDAISNCWQYETTYTKSGQPRFKFIKQNSEYVQKKGRDVICECGCECLREQPLNTPTNVGRILNSIDYPEVQQLGYKDSTVTAYWRIDSKKLYGNSKQDKGSFEDVDDMKTRIGYIEGYVWCKLDAANNRYIPLNQEQMDYFRAARDDRDKITNEELDNLVAEYEQKEISKEEYLKAVSKIYGDEDNKYNKIANLISAKKEFKEKYGFYPCLAKKYVTYGVNDKKQEEK